MQAANHAAYLRAEILRQVTNAGRRVQLIKMRLLAGNAFVGKRGQHQRAFRSKQLHKRIEEALRAILNAAQRLEGGMHKDAVARLNAQRRQIACELFFGVRGFGKAAYQCVNGLFNILSVRFHNDLPPAMIERLAVFVQITQGLPFFEGDAAGGNILETAFDGFITQLQKHDHTAFGKMLHGAFLHRHGTAGSNDGVLQVQAADAVFFRLGKSIRAQFVHHLLQRFAELVLHDQISIHKIHHQSLGKQYAQRAFAAARHADQNDVSHFWFPPYTLYNVIIPQKSKL